METDQSTNQSPAPDSPDVAGCPAPICYARALDLCAAGGISPLCANLDPSNPKTINDVLEDLGGRLPPVPDDVAKALAVTTIYSLETIRNSFA